MKLVAKEPFVYATRRLLPGDVFRVRPCDAGILRMVGKAEDAPAAEPVSYVPVAPVVEEQKEKKPKRKYTRRKKKEPEAGPTEVGQE